MLQPQVIQDNWYEINGPRGIEWVIADYVDEIDLSKFDGDDKHTLPKALSDFCENNEAWGIELIHGFGARMSASGYLDCTDWCVFFNEVEAYDYLAETYDLCPGCLGELILDEECPYC